MPKQILSMQVSFLIYHKEAYYKMYKYSGLLTGSIYSTLLLLILVQISNENRQCA